MVHSLLINFSRATDSNSPATMAPALTPRWYAHRFLIWHAGIAAADHDSIYKQIRQIPGPFRTPPIKAQSFFVSARCALAGRAADMEWIRLSWVFNELDEGCAHYSAEGTDNDEDEDENKCNHDSPGHFGLLPD